MMTTPDIHTDIVRELLKGPVGMVRGALHGSIVVASYKPSKDAENEAKRHTSVKRSPLSRKPPHRHTQ